MASINTTLTIANGQSASGTILALDLHPAVSLWIGAPLGLSENVRLRSRRPGGQTWYDQQTNGQDIVLTAGKAVQLTVLCAVEWRLETVTGNVGADRVFEVMVNRIVGFQGLL